jgi:hypothetical protein
MLPKHPLSTLYQILGSSPVLVRCPGEGTIALPMDSGRARMRARCLRAQNNNYGATASERVRMADLGVGSRR